MSIRRHLMSGLSVCALAAVSIPVQAQAAEPRRYEIPSQDLGSALRSFARVSKIQVIFDGDAIRGKRSEAVTSRTSAEDALRDMLRGTGLSYRRDGKVFIISAAQKTSFAIPMVAASAAQVGASVTPQVTQYDDIIVTAQKKEERISDVPIAMSAFTPETLDEYKIEGGSELLRAVPNVAFSKTNFASYNFSIRGIGTKALSVSTDPAVAISFNNTPLIRNRLFEQEYFDVERVEVLRGPQGTLYGRNATGGVVNMISAKPELEKFDGSLKGEVGNFNSRRLAAMVNIPLGDKLAFRAAGAMTQRDGYDYNTYTENRVNGRDLWSARGSLAWNPSDRFKATAIWERFSEDDNRSRTGKQLCHRDDGPEEMAGEDITSMVNSRAVLSQTCLSKSLYDDAAFGVPNGLSLPHVIAGWSMSLGNVGGPAGPYVTLFNEGVDPYDGLVQSRNLREIHTKFDPVFRAKNDVVQLNLEFDVSDNIKFYSQSSYTRDKYYSTQDYYRYVSNDVFNDSRGLYNLTGPNQSHDGWTPAGVFTDYQLGESKKLVGLDMVRSESDQYYQEFRIASSNSGKFNFNIGANYTKFKIEEDYFVFNNLFTLLAHGMVSPWGIGGEVGNCDDVAGYVNCAYVDPNPIDKINGEGHNYFRSRNVSSTESFGLYGEAYYNLSDNVKITGGLRYTDDKKVATPYKSQLLLAPGFFGGGLVGRGSPASPDIVQKWGRLTGRLVVDWKPEVDFASDLLVYASYARGYKGGGANPPGIGFDPTRLRVFENPETFDPETVNSFELGVKGVAANGRLTFGASAFYYDYKGYQVSQIVDRLALNENFDAEMWGADLELVYRPSSRLKFNANLGYLGSRIKDGQSSIDVMNRTQGNDDYVVVKPWMQLSSNCVAPRSAVEAIFAALGGMDGVTSMYLSLLCGGSYMGDFREGGGLDAMFGFSYEPLLDGPGQGRGIAAPLGGNELPNAPRTTLSLGAQYRMPLNDGWDTSLRVDYYRQGSSWARVYNTEIDRLRSWENFNLTVGVDNLESGLAFQFYVKNIFNKNSITDVFLNSDDSGLTANIFTVDPRLIGFSIKKSF